MIEIIVTISGGNVQNVTGVPKGIKVTIKNYDNAADTEEFSLNTYTNEQDKPIDKVNEQVNHPKHYNSHPSGIECIDIVRHHNFNVGNVIKYLWRQGLKEGNSDLQELKKASWYLNDEINRVFKTVETKEASWYLNYDEISRISKTIETKKDKDNNLLTVPNVIKNYLTESKAKYISDTLFNVGITEDNSNK